MVSIVCFSEPDGIIPRWKFNRPKQVDGPYARRNIKRANFLIL